MATEPRSLTGKVVAITGGGRGIGRAIAQALAREGARVAVCDLDRELAEQTAASLGEPALGLAVDVTDHAALVAFIDEVEQRLGPLDVLVNNAGIMPVTPLVDESADSIARQLDLNLRAVIHGTQEAMRRMVPRRTGHIVNLSSIAGRSGFPYLATYCATKHGVVGLSEAARVELRDTGVEVSVVMPSVVRTELTDRPGRLAREGDRARGRRRRGRLRAQEAALRRLRAALERPADPAHEPAPAHLARGDRPLDQGRQVAARRRPLGARRVRGAARRPAPPRPTTTETAV